ncbi:peptidylprolyl isomerase [Algoriphagus limi]|uniref:Peptidyl-prolyl cis-trans isomerase n=1 Tax=Algoriphagus limi TaxID=2975273 RepID=A0ABT2G483_9BACT|nr:peptidylprolyl isomerase [Algoriphagus limi]MCS5490004.1 peptidylprolyl isomerase [Algoriphagus limi]
MHHNLIWLFVSLLLTITPEEKIPMGQILTPLGEILIQLDNRTPNHRDSFIQLAEAGYWDSLTFNRVIPDFVAQGGCPDTPEGFNDPEYLLEPEFHQELTHVYGAVGAGRDDNEGKVSARCQFYIVQNKDGLHRLDGNYTVFGKVIKGMDILDQIVHVERDDQDEPLTPITLDINILYLSPNEIKKLTTQEN